MNVAELIEKLKQYNPDMRVVMQDRVITLVSLEIKAIKEIEFCSAFKPTEVVVQLIPEE